MISVIIPVNGQTSLLPRALDSVLNQTFSHFEVIVVHHLPWEHYLWELGWRTLFHTRSPKLEEIEDRYRGEDKVRFISGQEGNVAHLFNLGLKEAQGDYICWLEPEDYFLPYKLKAQWRQFHQEPGIDVSYSDAYITLDGFAFDYWRGGKDEGNSLYLSLLGRSFIHRSTLMVSRQAFEKVGFLDPQFKLAPELDWLLSSTKSCSFGYLNYPTVKLHVRSGLKFLNRQLTREERRISLRQTRLNLAGYHHDSEIVSLAFALIKRDLLKEAQRLFKVVVRRNSKFAEAWWGSAVSLMGRGDLRKAKDLLERALEVSPDSLEGMYHLAVCDHRLKDPVRVIEDCHALLKIYPNYSADPYYLKALAQIRQGDLQRAKEELEKSEGLQVHNITYVWEMARTLFKLKRYELALGQFEKVNEPYPDYPFAYYFRALCLFQLGRFRDAISLASHAINKGLTNPKIYDLLARAMVRFDWGAAAEEIWKMGIEQNPLHPGSYFNFIHYCLAQRKYGLLLQQSREIFSLSFLKNVGRALVRFLISLALRLWLRTSSAEVSRYPWQQLKFYLFKYQRV